MLEGSIKFRRGYSIQDVYIIFRKGTAFRRGAQHSGEEHDMQ